MDSAIRKRVRAFFRDLTLMKPGLFGESCSSMVWKASTSSCVPKVKTAGKIVEELSLSIPGNLLPKNSNYKIFISAVVVFIAAERENRLAIGGATNGWKRVDYTVILQVYAHSLHPNSEDVMTDFDTLIDNIKERLRSDHNFGDTTGNLVWQGAEPVINGRYGEPATNNEGATDIFAELEFDVTEMIQA